MTKQSATDRVLANVKVIREMLQELDYVVTHYEADADDADWGHVGDLANIRGCLHTALGHEDNPDPE